MSTQTMIHMEALLTEGIQKVVDGMPATKWYETTMKLSKAGKLDDLYSIGANIGVLRAAINERIYFGRRSA